MNFCNILLGVLKMALLLEKFLCTIGPRLLYTIGNAHLAHCGNGTMTGIL